MKAITHNKACMPDKTVRSASASARLRAATHSLKRRLVGASPPALAAEAPRLTVTILDGPFGTAAARESGTLITGTPMLVYPASESVRNDQLAYLPKPFTTPRQLWSTMSTLLGIASGLTAGGLRCRRN